MEILHGVDLDEALLGSCITAGRQGHEIALAHHNDPGANGFTFGSDRYHRSCELLKKALLAHGFRICSKGAALHARRGDVELRFATAKSPDLTAPSSFDMTTPSRLEAGNQNIAVAAQIEGLEELLPAARKIAHVVWSGDPGQGLTAVHIGHLVSLDEKHVQWSELKRIDSTNWATVPGLQQDDTTVVPYAHQQDPGLGLSVVEEEQEVNRADGTEK
ncbi:hypothetical protein [Kocuria salina]|uniref:hypothetical protein n=1 Tax=Kocuria salina TaxID=1929416 RepID=UPI001592C438|nr:hypothetical protein [Kocuria salina]